MGKNKKIGNSLSDLINLDFGEEEVKEMPKNNENKNNQSQHNKKDEYANAPYNFIEFPDRVVHKYDNIDDLPKHDVFRSDLNTGYIEYKIKNINPLFIGSGKGQIDEFFQVGNNFVIPGSTMRGRVRSNAEVLSFSYPQFVEDRSFLYRDIAGETISKIEYYENLELNEENVDISDKLQAGYLYRENNNYYIQPAKEISEKSFYKVNENFLIKKWNMGWNNFSGYNTMYFYTKDKDKFIVNESSRYKAYETPLNINFNLNNNGGISKICPTERENLSYKGKLYNSNYIRGKKNHYVINEPNELEKKIKVPDYLIHQFEKDYKDNKIKNPFYHLPKSGEKKVVFYKIENYELKYFGRTPYLRIFYENSIEKIKNKNILSDVDIYDEKNKNLKYKIDYSDAVFGFTNKILKIKNKEGKFEDVTTSYKGRVNFSDLKLEDGKEMDYLEKYEENKDKKQLILSNPKPTSFQLYLKQNKLENKELTSYNNPQNEEIEENKKRIEPELRGQKFYWQKEKIDNVQEAKSNNMKKNFKALEEKQIFTGKIHFENLANDELGLLLLSLKYDDNTKDNIGMAKPYGYGKVDMKDIELVIEKKKESFKDFFNDSKEIITSKDEKFEEFKNKFKINCLEKYNEKREDKYENYYDIPIIKQYKVSKSTIENKEIERNFDYEYSRGNNRTGMYKVNDFNYMEIEKQTDYKNDENKKIKINEYKDRKTLRNINDYL